MIPAALHLVEYGGNFNWFPGHMAKATKQIVQKTRSVDFVIEVRDARLPFVCRNPDLEQLIPKEKRVLVLNKADLAERGPSREAQQFFSEQGLLTVLTRANKDANRESQALRQLIRRIVWQFNLKRS